MEIIKLQVSKRLILCFFISIIFSFNCDNNNPNWIRIYGGDGVENVARVIESYDNGYIIAGSTNSFGADPYQQVFSDVYEGTSDGWLIKINNSGKIIWQNTYGQASNENFWDIQYSNEGGYILAGEKDIYHDRNSLWVLKIDQSGNIIWEKSITGDKTYRAESIQKTGDAYIICGNVVDFEKAFVIKLNEDGSINWEKYFTLYKNNACLNVKATIDGGFILLGTTGDFKNEKMDYWVIKLDNKGDVLWSKIYDSSGNDSPSEITVTTDGGYILGGSTYIPWQSKSGLWVLKTDSDGNIQWQKKYSNKYAFINFGYFTLDDDGSIVMVGYFDYGILIIKINPNGDIQWQTNYNLFSYYSNFINHTKDNGYIISALSREFNIMILKINNNGDMSGGCFNDYNSDNNIYSEDTNAYPSNTTINVVNSNSLIAETNVEIFDSYSGNKSFCD